VPLPNVYGWNETSVTVTITAVDDESGVATVHYALDGGPRSWCRELGPSSLLRPKVSIYSNIGPWTMRAMKKLKAKFGSGSIVHPRRSSSMFPRKAANTF